MGLAWKHWGWSWRRIQALGKAHGLSEVKLSHHPAGVVSDPGSTNHREWDSRSSLSLPPDSRAIERWSFDCRCFHRGFTERVRPTLTMGGTDSRGRVLDWIKSGKREEAKWRPAFSLLCFLIGPDGGKKPAVAPERTWRCLPAPPPPNVYLVKVRRSS